MKRLKIIAVAIITILLVALGTYNGVEAIYNSSEKGYQSKYQLGIGKGFEFTWDLWRKDNLYCVEYDQKMSDGVYYGFTWSNPVTIEGDKATFGDGRVVISPYNNILAAIVCPTDLGRRSRFAGSTYTWSYRMGDNGVPTNSFGNGRKSDAQEGLYYYWNVWYDSMKDANGNNVAYENGFRRDPNGWKGDGNDTHKYCGQWGYNRLKELNLLEKYRTSTVPAKKLPELFENILRYVDEHFTENLRVSEVADAFFISRSTLGHMFKKYLNLSPIKYIEAKKLALSKKLLEEGENVKNVCYACGFSDCSYFVSVFKKYFGITPYKYGKTNKQ